MTTVTRLPGAVPDDLRALDRAGIAWCVWKGTTHLDQSLSGDGDLDVLVDPGAHPAVVHRSLRAAGFRPLQDRSAPGRPVEDWLGLSTTSGRPVHVQVYRSVLLDDGIADRWALPVADEVLASPVTRAGLPAAAPVHEALLVVLQHTARMCSGVGRLVKQPSLPRLRQQVQALVGDDPARVLAVAEQWLGPEAASLVGGVLEDRRDATSELAAALDAAGFATDVGPSQRVGTIADRVARRVSSGRAPTRRRSRVLGPPGLAVAVIGADGAGKSSLVAGLAADFGRAVDVRTVYLGSGDGSSSVLLVPLKWARDRLPTGASTAPNSGGGAPRPASPPTGAARERLVGLARAVWAVALVRERRAAIGRVRRSRSAGALVVCDRFPQVTVAGIQDGPRLVGWDLDHRRWRRALAAWERRAYAGFAADESLDLVLRLRVSLEVAVERRPDHDAEDLRRRIDVVTRVAYGAETVELDADQPAAAVRDAARRAVVARMP